MTRRIDRDQAASGGGGCAASAAGGGRASDSEGAASRRRSSSSSWNGSGVERERMVRRSTWTSTSPVGMFGLTASGRAADDLALPPEDELVANAVRGRVRLRARSGLTTSWQSPVWSRRSTKTRPPWSRRVSAQPASVSRWPTCSARTSPHMRSRHFIGVATASSTDDTSTSSSPAPTTSRPSSPDDDDGLAPRRCAWVSWPLSERPA